MEHPVRFILLMALMAVYALVIIRFLLSRFGPVRKVSASVIHKQKVEFDAPKAPNGKHTKYAVTFQIQDKTKSFYVSELSYNGYRRGEQGILTYRGDRLIDFH